MEAWSGWEQNHAHWRDPAVICCLYPLAWSHLDVDEYKRFLTWLISKAITWARQSGSTQMMGLHLTQNCKHLMQGICLIAKGLSSCIILHGLTFICKPALPSAMCQCRCLKGFHPGKATLWVDSWYRLEFLLSLSVDCWLALEWKDSKSLHDQYKIAQNWLDWWVASINVWYIV